MWSIVPIIAHVMFEQVQGSDLFIFSHFIHFVLSDLLVFLWVDLWCHAEIGIVVAIVAHQISLYVLVFRKFFLFLTIVDVESITEKLFQPAVADIIVENWYCQSWAWEIVVYLCVVRPLESWTIPHWNEHYQKGGCTEVDGEERHESLDHGRETSCHFQSDRVSS